MSNTLVNAALFHNGSRRFRNINVDVTDTEVIVKNPVNGDPLATFPILDTAKAGEAWDSEENGVPFRLVVQLGCGCSGMRRYDEDASYKTRKLAQAATIV